NEDSPDQHPEGDRTPGGSNTQDYIFFLSINEVKTFLKNKRLCREQIYCLPSSATSWLRSPGYLAHQAAILKVDESTPDTYGMLVTSPQGVRPALWLNY
ncbi:MAG: hypothetical protein II180_08145, partial [Proteobacteria bacterium]|nr:hypothetical protein [Pseudomonadota bacterium]